MVKRAIQFRLCVESCVQLGRFVEVYVDKNTGVIMPCLARKEFSAWNSPPLSDGRLLILRLNLFSTKVLNLQNVEHT